MKTTFVPILARKPSGDRNATLAVCDALESLSATVGIGIEGYDGNALRPLEAVQREADSHGSLAVFLYSGPALIVHLKNLEARKAATTHLGPDELTVELKEKTDIDIKRDFGLDFLNCPIYAQGTIAAAQEGLFATQTVPMTQAALGDLAVDAIFAKAADKKFFIVSLPAARNEQQDIKQQIFLAQLIRKRTLKNYSIVLVSNPRSGKFIDGLAERLGENFPIVAARDEFTGRVLPALKDSPQSLLYLPGDSAAMLAEAMAVLPPQQIILNGIEFIDAEHELLVRQFHETYGLVSLLTPEAVRLPTVPPVPLPNAALEIATALLERFSALPQE